MPARIVRLGLMSLALGAPVATAGAQFRTAQALQRPVEPLLGGGGSLALGRAGNALGNGLNALAGVTLHSGALPFGVRVALGYEHFPAKTGRVDPATAITAGYAQIASATLGATLGMPTGLVRPYAVAGVGYHDFRSKRHIERIVGGDAIEASEVRQSARAWGLNGGVGVRGGMYGVKGFVELRFENVFVGHGDAFGENQLRVIPLTAGFAF